jgi:hypothetical protein
MIEIDSKYNGKKVRFVALVDNPLIIDNMSDICIGNVVRALFASENDSPHINPFKIGSPEAIAFALLMDKQNDVFNEICRLENKEENK